MAENKKAKTATDEKEFPEELSEEELSALRPTEEERERLADYLKKHRAAATRAANAAKRMRATRDSYAALVLEMKARRYDEIRHESFKRRMRSTEEEPAPEFPDPEEAIRKMMGTQGEDPR